MVFTAVVSLRYAFSPLLDEESEEEDKEPVMNEAFGQNPLPPHFLSPLLTSCPPPPSPLFDCSH